MLFFRPSKATERNPADLYTQSSSALSLRGPASQVRRTARKTFPPALVRRSAHATCSGRITGDQPLVPLSSTQISLDIKQPLTSGMPRPVPPVSMRCQSQCGSPDLSRGQRPPSIAVMVHGIDEEKLLVKLIWPTCFKIDGHQLCVCCCSEDLCSQFGFPVKTTLILLDQSIPNSQYK